MPKLILIECGQLREILSPLQKSGFACQLVYAISRALIVNACVSSQLWRELTFGLHMFVDFFGPVFFFLACERVDRWVLTGNWVSIGYAISRI